MLKVFVVVAVLAFCVAIFVRNAMNDCNNFTIESQNGKSFLVTGANSGIGFYTSLFLAQHGAEVLMAARSRVRGEAAVNEIKSKVPNANVRLVELDLSSLNSVRSVSEQLKKEFNENGKTLDVLVNNAGVMAIPQREKSADGFELQMATNHFGHFLLTSLLLPILSKDGRIVNHASGAHMFAPLGYTNDLNSEKSYDPWVAYGMSKMANLDFTDELNERLIASGSKLTSYAVHPGYTGTNLQRGTFPGWEKANEIFAMKVEDGSQSQILAATAPKSKLPSPSDSHVYIGPRYLMFGAPKITSTLSSLRAWINKDWKNKQEKDQKNLWEESVKLTGAKWSF